MGGGPNSLDVRKPAVVSKRGFDGNQKGGDLLQPAKKSHDY